MSRLTNVRWLASLALFAAACADDGTDGPDADVSADVVADVAEDSTDISEDVIADVVDAADTGDDADAADTQPDVPDVEDVEPDIPDVGPDVPDVTPDVDAGDTDLEEVGDTSDTDAGPGVCGDGFVDPTEECDDGNDDDSDECLSDCTASACGDGVVNETFGQRTFAFPRVADPAGVTAFVCDDGASCPAGNQPGRCNVSERPNASEHGICQALRFEYATTVEWGGGPGDGLGAMHHAYNWECFEYACEQGAFTSYTDDCSESEMLLEISCEGVVLEQCDDGDDNGDRPDACRSDCTRPTCGDSIIDSGEQCDDGGLENGDRPDACRSNCQLPACGDAILDTGEECDEGDENENAPDQCRRSCLLPTCGDAIVDSGEECDDGNDDEEDGCSNTCRIVGCRDGVLQPELGEECDDGNDIPDDECTNECTLPRCGDGVVSHDEECDDGNDVDLDECRLDCTLPTCGDGVVSAYTRTETFESPVVLGPTGAIGHVCDVGATCQSNSCDVSTRGDANEHGICQSLGLDRALFVEWGFGEGDMDESMPHAYNWDCEDFECGPSTSTYDRDNCSARDMLATLQCAGFFPEECDEGSANSDLPGSTCRTNCRRPYCGDGVLDPENGEECDDGNIFPDDGCSNLCLTPQCGDGVQQAGEECDDGNLDNSDECLTTCELAECGDGFLAAWEDCDDGPANSDEPDAFCRVDCSFPRCGDNIVDTGEECDDGNLFSRDECTALCTLPVCGDGFRHRESGEECDDGNGEDGDGCTADCLREEGFEFGQVIYIGHDMFGVNDDIRQLVGNAVLEVSEIAAGEVRVLGYDQHADRDGEADNTDEAIRAEAAERGRTVLIDRLSDHTLLGERIASYDVLVIYEPEAGNASLMESVGADWADHLETFLSRGGVVVVTDANSNAWRLLNSAGVLASEGTGGTSGDIDIVLEGELLVEGVSDPYRAAGATGYLRLPVETRAEIVATDSSGRAVVVQLVW